MKLDQKVGKLPAIASHTCNFFQNYSGGKNIESFCSNAQKSHWLFSVRVDFKIESVFIAGKQKENEIIYIYIYIYIKLRNGSELSVLKKINVHIYAINLCQFKCLKNCFQA